VTGKLHYVQNKYVCTIKITQYAIAPAINYSNVCLHTHLILKFSFVSRMRFIKSATSYVIDSIGFANFVEIAIITRATYAKGIAADRNEL